MDELEAKYFSDPESYGKAMELLQRHRKAQAEANSWTEYEENFLMKLGGVTYTNEDGEIIEYEKSYCNGA